MKKIRIKSAIPIYLAAAVWVLVGLIKPSFLLQLGTLIVTALISVVVYIVGSKIFPGKEVEVRERVDTGDAEINRMIEEARQRLDNLQKYNDVLPDPIITDRLNRMKHSGDTILDELEKNPKRYSEVRRFMNYYLPTAEKLMSNYVTLTQTPAKGENIRSAMTSVENSMGMIADAFDKQLDSLYRDYSFDIDADVSVLETLLKSEGLIGNNDFSSVQKEKDSQDSQKAQTGI